MNEENERIWLKGGKLVVRCGMFLGVGWVGPHAHLLSNFSVSNPKIIILCQMKKITSKFHICGKTKNITLKIIFWRQIRTLTLILIKMRQNDQFLCEIQKLNLNRFKFLRQNSSNGVLSSNFTQYHRMSLNKFISMSQNSSQLAAYYIKINFLWKQWKQKSIKYDKI